MTEARHKIRILCPKSSYHKKSPRELANIETWLSDDGVRFLQDLGNIPENSLVARRVESGKVNLQPRAGALAFRHRGVLIPVTVTAAPSRHPLSETDSGGWHFTCTQPCRTDERLKNRDVARGLARVIGERSGSSMRDKWDLTIWELRAYCQ